MKTAYHALNKNLAHAAEQPAYKQTDRALLDRELFLRSTLVPCNIYNFG